MGEKIILQRGVLRRRKSEYHLDGLCNLPEGELKTKVRHLGSLTSFVAVDGVQPEWELKAVIPRADVRDFTSLAEGMRSNVKEPAVANTSSVSSDWEVPDLPLEQQLAWFENYMLTTEENERRDEYMGALQRKTEPIPTLTDIRGQISGSISIRSGSQKEGRDLEVDTWLNGRKVRLGSHVLGDVEAQGFYRNGTLVIEPIHARGPDGFEMMVFGRLESGGKLEGLVSLKRAPMQAISQYTKLPFRVEGLIGTEVEIGGTFDNPVVHGEAVWTKAMVNRQRVRHVNSQSAQFFLSLITCNSFLFPFAGAL